MAAPYLQICHGIPPKSTSGHTLGPPRPSKGVLGQKKPFFSKFYLRQRELRDPRGRGRPFNGRRAPRRHAPLAAADWLRAGQGGGAAPWAGKALREKRPRRHFEPRRHRGSRGVPGGSGPGLGPAAPHSRLGGLEGGSSWPLPVSPVGCSSPCHRPASCGAAAPHGRGERRRLPVEKEVGERSATRPGRGFRRFWTPRLVTRS